MYGDGSSEPVTLVGDKLEQFDTMLQQGIVEGGKRLVKPIS